MTDLRQRISDALIREHHRRAAERIEASPEQHQAAFADIVMAIIQPEIAKRDTELDGLRERAATLVKEANHYAAHCVELLRLLKDLVDRDPCWLDHNGGCQAHGYLALEPGELCPHAEAKQILAAHEAEAEQPTERELLAEALVLLDEAGGTTRDMTTRKLRDGALTTAHRIRTALDQTKETTTP